MTCVPLPVSFGHDMPLPERGAFAAAVTALADRGPPPPGYSRSSCDIRGRGWMLVMWAGASPRLTNLCALPGGAITI